MFDSQFVCLTLVLHSVALLTPSLPIFRVKGCAYIPFLVLKSTAYYIFVSLQVRPSFFHRILIHRSLHFQLAACASILFVAIQLTTYSLFVS